MPERAAPPPKATMSREHQHRIDQDGGCFECEAKSAPSPPDKNCITTGDGGCIGTGCMHDSPPEGTPAGEHETPTHRTERWVLDATDGYCPQCLVEKIADLTAQLAQAEQRGRALATALNPKVAHKATCTWVLNDLSGADCDCGALVAALTPPPAEEGAE